MSFGVSLAASGYSIVNSLRQAEQLANTIDAGLKTGVSAPVGRMPHLGHLAFLKVHAGAAATSSANSVNRSMRKGPAASRKR